MKLHTKGTALVLIDLQNGIVGMPLAPYSGAEVVQRCARLAQAFRDAGGTVIYVRVDMADFRRPPVDAPHAPDDAPPPPDSASELVPDAGFWPENLLVTKRSWGASGDTDIESQLRSRGVDTVVIAGIATYFGVESTARAAADLGFAVVLAEDAATTFTAEMHGFAFEVVFPQLGRVRSTEQIIDALA